MSCTAVQKVVSTSVFNDYFGSQRRIGLATRRRSSDKNLHSSVLLQRKGMSGLFRLRSQISREISGIIQFHSLADFQQNYQKCTPRPSRHAHGHTHTHTHCRAMLLSLLPPLFESPIVVVWGAVEHMHAHAAAGSWGHAILLLLPPSCESGQPWQLGSCNVVVVATLQRGCELRRGRSPQCSGGLP